MNTYTRKEPAGVVGPFSRHDIAPRTVLVPMLNLSIANDMLHLAAVLASGHKPPPSISPTPLDDIAFAQPRSQPRIVVLGVVEVPDGQPLTMGMDMARSYRALFDFLPPDVDAEGRQVRVDRVVKVARDVPSAVRLAVEEEHVDIVLAHWKGHTQQSKRNIYGHVLDALLKDPPCDVMLARPDGWHDCSRVLLPVRGGPSAVQALDVALLLAEHNKLPITVLHNVPAPKATTGPLGARGGTGPLGDALTRHSTGPLPDIGNAANAGNTTIKDAIEAGPYIEFNEHLESVARKSSVRVERLGTANSSTADAVLGEIQPYDIVIMGLSAPPSRGKTADPASSLPRTVAAGTRAPMLLLRTREKARPETPNKHRQKANTRQQRASWVDMPFEYWFVDNTYHGDEFRDPEEFLKLKRASGQTISVALLTSNDARHMHSMLTGLKRVLMEMHPLADQLAIIDAGSGDDTLGIARSLGVDAYLASEILPDEGSLHGRGESWWKSLGVLRGDIVVWLDTRATRFHPGTALSLAGPLLRTPGLQLVKAFASTPAQPEPKGKAASPNAPQAFVPTDASWGGFVVPRRDGAWPFAPRIRVQALKPSDLALLTPAEFALLPPRTIVQVLCSSLAGVVEPFGRDVAARRTAMISIPAFTGHNLELGMLLSVAQQHGSRAVAQVELRHAQPAPPPQPSLRNAIDVLQILSIRLDDPDLCQLAANTALRLQTELEGGGNNSETPFEVRALNPVERKPMDTVIGARG